MSEKVLAKDIVGVKSRIAWGAVFGGFFVVVVTLTLLSTFESAIRMSVVESSKQLNSLSHSEPVILRNIAGFMALFAGGWATSQYVARETKVEAAFYGIVLWGVSFMALLFLAMNGIAWSLSYVMGINNIIQNYMSAIELKDMGDTMGLTPEQFGIFEEMMKDRVSAGATAAASWWSFAGIVGSIIATVAGSVLGSGPRQSSEEAVIVASLPRTETNS